MAPFRNPFQRKPPPLNGVNGSTDGTTPTPNGQLKSPESRASLSGSRQSSALSIPKAKEPDDIKLSVVNDSGVYLPPSPPEKKGFWHRTPTSTTTSSHRSMLSENEPFSISRESFESYRRSFDISARSPVTHPDAYASRQSLDSRGRQSLDSRSPRALRTNGSNLGRPDHKGNEVLDEETFEEVGLNDEQKPKKRGLFERFSGANEPGDENARPGSSHRGFHLPGRKRGQSGQGSELGNMENPDTKAVDAAPPTTDGSSIR
ncbi:MAG: hypothetical protein MMC23_001764 [Stictis urceolatum]|nr:hypothetical protein [Stictis urceolata]